MTNKTVKTFATEYAKALDMQVSLTYLKYLINKGRHILKNCYDIDLIKKGFRKYHDKAIDREYFLAWCELYALLIEKSYELNEKRDIPYHEISSVLSGVSVGNTSVIKALAEIELSNEVIIGKREGDYRLASDYETFYCYREKEDTFIDYVEINVKNKTFTIYRLVDDSYIDGCDCLGDDFECYPVSRAVFEIICKGVAEMGYKEIK